MCAGKDRRVGSNINKNLNEKKEKTPSKNRWVLLIFFEFIFFVLFFKGLFFIGTCPRVAVEKFYVGQCFSLSIVFLKRAFAPQILRVLRRKKTKRISSV